MKNLLFISSLPFPLNKGSNQHAYLFLKALAGKFNVYCIFFIQPETVHYQLNMKPLMDMAIKDYKICYFQSHVPQNPFFERLRILCNFPYSYMNLATHSEGIKTINDCIKKYSINIVHIEHLHYVKYAFHMPQKVKKVFVYHDMYHRIPWQLIQSEKIYHKKLFLFISGLKKYIFERLLERIIDLKIFLNPVEMLALPNKSLCIPHIINPAINYREPVKNDCCHILFLGGYNHAPNRRSVKYILDGVLPALAKRTSNFRLILVGSGMEKFNDYLKISPFKNLVKIKGFVEDINEIFGDTDIALFPILDGGGIKTKIIEAMAAGIPVVTTSEGIFGLTGLPEKAVSVGNHVEDITEKVLALITNFPLRVKCSQVAKEYVDENHSYDTIAEKLTNSYKKL